MTVRGRPRKPDAMSNAERQRLFRERRAEELERLRRMAEAIDQAGPRLSHPPKIDPFED